MDLTKRLLNLYLRLRTSSLGQVVFTNSEVATARSLVAKLDAKIKSTVGMLRPHLHYVDPLTSDSPFAGHELCTGNPYFHGVNVDLSAEGFNTEYSFHPNAEGQRAYYRLVRSYILASS